MTELKLESLLTAPSESFKRPPPPPVGLYRGRITKYDFDKTRGDPPKEFIRLYVTLVEPNNPEEITSEDLAVVGDLSKVRMTREYYADSLYRLTELMNSCDIPEEGRSLGERLTDMTGQEVLVTVGHRMSKEDEIFAEVKKLVGMTA